MIIFKDKKFLSYLHLAYYLIREFDEEVNENVFYHNIYWYARAAIEAKTGKRLTLNQVKRLLRKELALKTITLKQEGFTEHVSC